MPTLVTTPNPCTTDWASVMAAAHANAAAATIDALCGPTAITSVTQPPPTEGQALSSPKTRSTKKSDDSTS